MVIMEYYSIPFRYLHDRFYRKYGGALLVRPRAELKRILDAKFTGPAAVSVSWDELYSVLEDIEAVIARVLHRRTVFFWRHVYRRLAPTLPQEMGGKVDWVTKGLVRDIVETAIQKHGSLSIKSEFQSFNTVGVHKVLGGWFLKSFTKEVTDRATRYAYFKAVKNSNQLVPVSFSPSDLEDLYFVEGLAYEYWSITARLRAVGKGAALNYTPEVGFQYSSSGEIWDLFESYDSRAKEYSVFQGSSLGTWLPDLQGGIRGVLTFSPNVQNIDLSPVFEAMGLSIRVEEGGFLTNFVPGIFDARAFARAHEYVSESFASKKGYSLDVLATVFEVISERIITPPEQIIRAQVGEKEAVALAIYSLCRRAYALKSVGVYKEMHSASVAAAVKNLSITPSKATEQVSNVFNSLLMSDSNRHVISLWSRGPRFPISEALDGYLVDMNGIHQHFHNIFFGVKEDYAARGFIFEQSVRDELTRSGFSLQVRNFIFNDGSTREADAVFYIGDRLIVADCLSMWKPLDFDISRPKTMVARQRDLQKKLQQATSCAERLRECPVGRNFDFSSAKRIEYVVVTPSIEWIWAKTKDLWFDDGWPRIMRVNEFVAWAVGERTGRGEREIR